MPDFPTVPPTCGLAGGWSCALPLDGSTKSIKLHLRMHGHRYPQRHVVQCPFRGCSDTLRWMNTPRHIQTIHLGVRFRCVNCGKPYTRPERLANHTASLKCHGQCLFCIGKNMLSTDFRHYTREIVVVEGNRSGQHGHDHAVLDRIFFCSVAITSTMYAHDETNC